MSKDLNHDTLHTINKLVTLYTIF